MLPILCFCWQRHLLLSYQTIPQQTFYYDWERSLKMQRQLTFNLRSKFLGSTVFQGKNTTSQFTISCQGSLTQKESLHHPLLFIKFKKQTHLGRINFSILRVVLEQNLTMVREFVSFFLFLFSFRLSLGHTLHMMTRLSDPVRL